MAHNGTGNETAGGHTHLRLTRANGAIATLDGLRLAAALIVLLYHFLFLSWTEAPGDAGIRDLVGLGTAGSPPIFSALVPVTSAGWVGVEVFFVISGFVITMSAHGKRAGAFALGRFARLFPALLAFSLLACLVVSLTGVLPVHEAMMRTARSVVLFPKGPWIDGAIWTLVAELVFYVLIWAVLLLRQESLLPLLTRLAVTAQVVLWGAVTLSPLSGHDLSALAGSYPLRVTLISTGCFFLLGMLAYEAWANGLNAGRALWIAAAFACCIASLDAMAAHAIASTRFAQGSAAPILLWCAAMAVAAIGIARESQAPAAPAVQAWMRQIGLLTYPLYLVHQISGGWLLGRAYAAGVAPAQAVGLTTIACLAISLVFATRIERPARRAIMRLAGRGLMPPRGDVAPAA